jgi:hypothetical protein
LVAVIVPVGVTKIHDAVALGIARFAVTVVVVVDTPTDVTYGAIDMLIAIISLLLA